MFNVFCCVSLFYTTLLEKFLSQIGRTSPDHWWSTVMTYWKLKERRTKGETAW